MLQRHEDARLKALRAYRVLDTEAEASYDALARLAAAICGTPIALISLIDETRQWFKAKVGLGDVAEMPRERALCEYAIRAGALFEVPDAAADLRFASNPLVTGGPMLRFYAGAPLIAPGGEAIGTICVLDRRPRTLTGEQREQLELLAGLVVQQLEQGKRARSLAEGLASVAALTRAVLSAPRPEIAVRALIEAVGTATGGRAALLRRASDGTYGEVYRLDEMPLPGGRARAGGEPFHLDNAPDDELALPVFVGSAQPELVLAVRSSGGLPEGADRAVLELVAAAFAIAARNVGLFAESDRQRAELAEARGTQAELVARLARDVRGPVTSIVGFARMLEDDDRFPREAREALAVVRASGEHIGEVAAGIELLSRIELAAIEPQWRAIDLAALAAAAGAVPDGHAPGRVVGDPDLVATALTRLIEETRRPDQPVRARIEDLGEAVVLELTGGGAPPAGEGIQPTIGARLAMRIVERHRGSFRAGGSGTSWWVRMTFPVDPARVERRIRPRPGAEDVPVSAISEQLDGERSANREEGPAVLGS